MIAHARNCEPDECCGLIASDSAGAIRFAYPLTNSQSSPVTYTVDPEEHFAALTHAEANGWTLSGVFHSHPRGPASPSLVDVRSASDPDWLYLIFGDGVIRGFHIRDGHVSEVRLL